MSVHPHAASHHHAPSHGGAKRAGRVVLGFLRAHLIALSVIAALVLLYTLVGFFLVPYIARTQIENYVTDTLHLDVELGHIRFNPFSFDTSIAGLNLTETDGAPLVSFRHLYVNAEPAASLRERAIVLADLELSAPNVQTIIARDGSVNLAKLAPTSTEPAPAEKTAPPRVHIERLSITQGRIGLEDRTKPDPFTAAVSPITFRLRDFRTDAGHQNPYRFSGTTAEGEQLEWSGDFTVQPLESTGRFRIQALRMTTIDSYVDDSLPFKLASGNALVHGSYAFKLEPLALDVTLPAMAFRDVTLTERKLGADVPIKLPRIDVENVALSMAKRDLSLARVNVRDAHIDVAREKDGTISLQRLMQAQATAGTPDHAQQAAAATPSAETTSPASSSSDAPSAQSEWNVHVDTIHVENASINAEDRTVAPVTRFELTPVGVTVNGWRSDPSAKLAMKADLTINQGARLVTKGDVQLEPLNTSLEFELSDFDLPVLQPYLEQATSVTLHSGKLSAKGDISYAATPDDAPPLAFSGEVQLADLHTTDQVENQDLLNWRDIDVTGIKAGLNPDRLAIDRVVIRQPFATVIIAPDRTLNVVQALSPGEPKDTTSVETQSERQGGPPATEQKTFPISIRTVEVVDGTMNFADHSIQPSFAAGIMELKGQVTGLSSDQNSRAQVSLAGKVDKYAPVDIGGEVNLFSATKYTQVAMSFSNMELTTFNPYSGRFAGYNISRGKLTTELRYSIVDRKLQAQHHIVLDNLQFGDKTDSKEAAPIPIKLAVALLKDRNGIIDLDVPVTGTLDDPKFRLGPIIWKALLNILTKIVTAPFAALGALFGGGEELAYVDFPAGSATLAPSDVEKLNKLSKALLERPAVRLAIPLTVTDEQDAKAIAEAALTAKIPEGTPAADGGERAKRKRLTALTELYETMTNGEPQFPPETMDEKKPNVDKQLAWLEQTLTDKLKPDQATLAALGEQRAHAIQDALLSNSELKPERVFLVSDRGEIKHEGKIVRLEMRLE